MKFLTIFAIFSIVVTLGNSAPTFLEWFGFDIDQATTELPDGEEPNLGENSSPTDIPHDDTTQTLIEVSTEAQPNTETPDIESTTEVSGSGDASISTQLPLLEAIIGNSENNKEIEAPQGPQGNNEAQKGEQDGNVNIENPDNQNKENTRENTDEKENSLESESQDPWKEFEDELNDEDDSKEKEGDDDNANEDDDRQNHKKKEDEDENSREAIKQYVKENIETVCSYDECNDQCQVRRRYGGYCKFGRRCICF